MPVDFGRYQLLKKIASGGMGQVFLARSGGSGGFEKLLVIKRILPQLVEDDEFIEMFFDEARIAARLNHPNLVQIFDLAEADGSHYLAMEYVAGEDLRRVDKKARAGKVEFPVGLILRITADAAAGLDYAHKARDAQGKPLNLVHRDVSPQNILVGFDGAVKLIDFGVAKAAGRMQHTASGILKGKYPYMSPEQADGRPMDGRSDQFALGIVCWELLTQQRLFKGDSDMETLRLVKDCLVPKPSSLNPSVTEAMDAVVLKALAPKVEDRFKDCASFRLAIEELLIKHSMAASSAHLSAWMQELYAERIEREADPNVLDELSASANIEPGSTPASRPSDSRLRAVRPPDGDSPGGKTVSSRGHLASDHGPAQPARRHETQALAPPPKRSVGKLAALGAAAVVLVGVGIAVPLMLRGQERKAEEPLVIPPTAPIVIEKLPLKPEVVPEVKPEPAKDVAIQVRSEPAGASVDVGGTVLGVTPLQLQVPADGSRVLAKVSLDGFEPNEAMISKADGPEFTVQLQKKRAVAKAGGTKKKDPPPVIKTGR